MLQYRGSCLATQFLRAPFTPLIEPLCIHSALPHGKLRATTLLCEFTLESIGKSFVTFFQRNHALVSKAKLLL